MATLSEEEAEKVTKAILPTIRKGIKTDPKGEVGSRIRDIADISPAVKREGNTPDVYCKIAGSMFKQGISTEIRIDYKGNPSYSFRKATKGEKPPTPEICERDWEEIEEEVRSYQTLKRMGWLEERKNR